MPNMSYTCRGKGETILFLHGWGQNKEMMTPFFECFEAKYKCIAIDMPGFGKSKYNNSGSISEYADSIYSFLKSKNINVTYIIGHSFGGKVAMEYCNKHQEIKKLVLISSPILKQDKTIKYYYKVLRYKIIKHLKLKNKNCGSEDYKKCPNNMKKLFINSVNTFYDKTICKVKLPTLLLYANKDKKVPVQKGKKLHKKLKNSDLYVLKGDHFAYLSNIELTSMIINNFLRRK